MKDSLTAISKNKETEIYPKKEASWNFLKTMNSTFDISKKISPLNAIA